MAARSEDLIPVSTIFDKRCGECYKENAPKKCGRCKTIRYCNEICQRKHWENHKNTCFLYNKPVNKKIQFIYSMDETIIMNYVRETFRTMNSDPFNIFSVYIDITGDITEFIRFNLILLFTKEETENLISNKNWDTSISKPKEINSNESFVFFFNFEEKLTLKLMDRNKFFEILTSSL